MPPRPRHHPRGSPRDAARAPRTCGRRGFRRHATPRVPAGMVPRSLRRLLLRPRARGDPRPELCHRQHRRGLRDGHHINAVVPRATPLSPHPPHLHTSSPVPQTTRACPAAVRSPSRAARTSGRASLRVARQATNTRSYACHGMTRARPNPRRSPTRVSRPHRRRPPPPHCHSNRSRRARRRRRSASTAGS